MQLANIMLAIGEDLNHVVPKYKVTPAECAVLILLHGDNSVNEIDILDEEVSVPSRQHISDLCARYGGAKDDDNQPIIRALFPAPTSHVSQTFADLGLRDETFTPTSQEKMGLNGEPAEKSVDDMTKAELIAYAGEREIEVDPKSNKSDILKAIETAQEPTEGASGALG